MEAKRLETFEQENVGVFRNRKGLLRNTHDVGLEAGVTISGISFGIAFDKTSRFLKSTVFSVPAFLFAKCANSFHNSSTTPESKIGECHHFISRRYVLHHLQSLQLDTPQKMNMEPEGPDTGKRRSSSNTSPSTINKSPPFPDPNHSAPEKKHLYLVLLAIRNSRLNKGIHIEGQWLPHAIPFLCLGKKNT